jgi:cytochrome c biogenesis protein
LTAATPTAARARRPAFDLWAPIWRMLTSVRFAVAYIALLALLGLLGVLIPQVPEAMRGNDAAIDAWLDTKRDTFGTLTDPMYRAGLFSLFQARWFLVALGFLIVFVSTCTFNRWSPTFRNVFHPPVRVPASFYDRAHNRTTLAPADVNTLSSALRSMRFGRIDVDARDGATHVFADRYPWTMLSTFVSHLALILFLAGGLVTWATGFTADRFAGEGTTFPVFAVSDPGQLQVRVDDAVGKYGPQGNALDFRTHLTIFKNGEEVKSGYTTVNDPLKYGGYRFHQAAFFPYGAALRIRDVQTGNTIFHEVFPLEETTAAPVITITDGAGRDVLRDTIAPTDFLEFASGTIVDVPDGDEGPVIWVGLTAKNDDEWELVAYDPRAGSREGELRLDEGASGSISGYRVRFEEVVGLPAAVGVDVPDLAATGGETLAQLVPSNEEGAPDSLMLIAEGRPAISLAPNDPVVSGYEYTFEGAREFTGISVKRDSGAWFIWIATGMLLVGLAITFYLPRRRLWIRLTGDSTQIAALAEKSGGFEKDMRTLARRLGVETPPEMREEA